MISEKKNGKKMNLRNFGELSDELRDFDLFINILLIVYMSNAKIF